MTDKHRGTALLLITLFALGSFSIMFILKEIGAFDFWWWMSSNLVLMISGSALLFKDYFPEIIKDFKSQFPLKLMWGLLSAAALYLVFMVGNYFSEILFSTAAGEISSIYDFKGDASKLRILVLMLVVIGPGEELFWRGFLQAQLMKRLKPAWGFVLATVLYTLVHVLTGNFMLVMAAMVAGVFWGWVYYRFKSITVNIISHVVWDVTIFLILPIG